MRNWSPRQQRNCTGVGMETIEGLRFLASLPLAGTGRTEGGEKTRPFKRFHSHLFITKLKNDLDVNSCTKIETGNNVALCPSIK